jgi:ribosomal protein S27E
MGGPTLVTCEICGEKAEVVQNSHVDPAGTRIEWPKAAVRSDGLSFAVNCPECGEREQCMAKASDTD